MILKFEYYSDVNSVVGYQYTSYTDEPYRDEEYGRIGSMKRLSGRSAIRMFLRSDGFAKWQSSGNMTQ